MTNNIPIEKLEEILDEAVKNEIISRSARSKILLMTDEYFAERSKNMRDRSLEDLKSASKYKTAYYAYGDNLTRR